MADRMILGNNAIYSMDSKKTGLNNNVIVTGSSGSGKTESIAVPLLLELCTMSLIAKLAKRTIAKKYANILRRRGYQVKILDIANPSMGDTGYDPLQYVCSYEDIRFLAESIIRSNPRKDRSNADPYWDDTAIVLLCALVTYVLMTIDDATFTDVLVLADRLKIDAGRDDITTSLDGQFERLEALYPGCYAVTCWNTFRTLPPKTANCVYGTLKTALDTTFSPALRKLMAMKNRVHFEQLATGKTVLFVITSAVNPATDFFVNMLFAQAFKSLFEFAEEQPDGTLPIPVHMLCDDFANGGRILNFPEYISIFREKRISVTLLIQSESQLVSMYGQNDATTIINNCDTYVYFGGMDLRTCHSISERLNAPLDEVLYMPVGREYIFRRGQKPVITTRYNILEDERYRSITSEFEKKIHDEKVR